MAKRKKKTQRKSNTQQQQQKNNNNSNNNYINNTKKSAKSKKSKENQIDSNNIDEYLQSVQEKQEPYPTPPHSFDIHLRKRELTCRVVLHKVPHHLITVEVLEDRLSVDTLKFTKKYKLDVEYPRGIKVDENSAFAEHDHGTLRIVMNIKEMPQSEQKKEIQLIKAKKEARKIKFESPLSKKVQDRISEYQNKTQKGSVKQQRKAKEQELNEKVAKLQELRNRVKQKKQNEKKQRKTKVKNRKRKRARATAEKEEPALKLQKTLSEDL